MKKNLFLAILLATCITQARAQYITCESMPIAYGNPPVTFTTSASVGDSVMRIPFTNNSGTNFAYPQARLVPLTPLPAGMTFHSGSQGWVVFASSWNTGNTDSAYFFFDVASTIPVDYTVDFEIRVTNFQPLSIDSCHFTDTLRLNLNPSGSGITETQITESGFTAYPNPTNGPVTLHFPAGESGTHTCIVYSAIGREMFTQTLTGNTARMEISHLPAGIYMVQWKSANQPRKIRIIKY